MSAESLLADMAAANLRPLWSGFPMSDTPRAEEPPQHWRWSDLRAFAERASAEVSMEDADRRVLLLANPHFKGPPISTGTLIAAIQVLNPGEIAEPHRHSIAAIRVITELDGGVTTVDGSKCDMRAGDLILTPAWCWHGHFNDGNQRAVWVDILDVPLVMQIDGVFFEHPNDSSPRLENAVPYADGDWEGAKAWPHAWSPKLRYTWEAMSALLDAAPDAADGSRRVRYENPLTGGPIMPTLDCHALRLPAGRPSLARRSTASSVFCVIEGDGVSRIGDQEISWGRNDVFTVPHWREVSHCAAGGAHLIEVSNGAMLASLGLLREATESQG